jgi:recombination protein RecR
VRSIVTCPTCGSLDTVSPCTICRDDRRDRSVIVVVEEMGDLWALERAAVINALYHVLGGHLSPLDGIGPERLNIASLHYLTEQLASTGVAVSRLAQGVPIGGELDYLDEGTLAAAIKARKRI